MGETQRDYRRALVRGGPSRMRRVSQVNGSGGRRASNIVSSDYVPPDVWRNLSQAERDQVIQSCGQRRGGRAQSGQRSSGARPRGGRGGALLPRQYSNVNHVNAHQTAVRRARLVSAQQRSGTDVVAGGTKVPTARVSVMMVTSNVR